MKNLLVSFAALTLLVFVACEPAAVIEESAETAENVAPDYAQFDKNVNVLRSFLKAHCDENLDLQKQLLSDTMQWSPAAYNGNEWLGKDDLVAALAGYHTDFENIQYQEGIVLVDTVANGMWSGSVFPETQATSIPVNVRQYGTWTAKHTASGKEIGVKWFALGNVNDAGKIVSWSEYFDVNGIAAQLAEE